MSLQGFFNILTSSKENTINAKPVLPKIFSSILACKNAQPCNYITVEVASEL